MSFRRRGLRKPQLRKIGADDAASTAAAGSPSLTLNFLDDQERSASTADGAIVAEAGADFACFEPGATLEWRLVLAGYNDASDPATPPAVAVFINCTAPQSVSGGTQLGSNIPLPETALTKKTATGTITAPAGSGFICVIAYAGVELDDDPPPFHTKVRSVGLQFRVAP